MFLLPLSVYNHNELLRNYVFINYGSNPSFWFSFNNETHENCATPHRGQPIYKDSKLGFICYHSYMKKSEITFRHWVLIVFLAVGCIVAIGAFLIARCCCAKKTRAQYHYEPEIVYPRDFKIADMKL